MAATLDQLIAAIAPTIPPTLIPPERLAAISTVAQTLPLPLGTTVGFECPLSTANTADFFLRVSSDWGRSLLAGDTQPPPVLTQLCVDHDLLPPAFGQFWTTFPWQQMRHFAQQWDDESSPLHTGVEDLWLEFDIAPVIKTLPPPSVFFGIQSSRSDQLDWVTQTALPTLLGRELDAATVHTLECCFAAIPTPASPFQVGILSGRAQPGQASTPIRLYIRDLTPSQVQFLLTTLAWDGDEQLLSQVLTQVCQGARPQFTLQLEIQKDLQPVIAVECYFRDRADWEQIFDRLIMTGFCGPDRAQALLNYPGYIRARDQVAPFPDLLQHWSSQLSPYRECMLVKRLAYLKFTYQPGQPLLAKAYLGLSPTWLDARYLDPADPFNQTLADQESLAINICKALIQQLDYAEIDVDEIFPSPRSQKTRWLNQALETLCVGG